MFAEKTMLNDLAGLDQELFLAVNKGWSNPFFDWLMPLLRNRYFWSPVYLFLTVFFARNYKKYGWLMLLFLFITFGMCDYLSSGMMKPIFERLRPCNDPDLQTEMNRVIACGNGFSFPSSHAANHFGIALFLITVFQSRFKLIIPLSLTWAFLIAFAQVYVGVHYPWDVTAGALLGGMIGYLTGTFFLAFYKNQIWKPES